MFKQFTNLKQLIIQPLIFWTNVAAGLIAGWIQNEVFSNIFTPAWVIGIIASAFAASAATLWLQKLPASATSNDPSLANTLPQSTSIPSKLTTLELWSLAICFFMFFTILVAMFWLPWKVGMQGLKHIDFSNHPNVQGSLNQLSSDVLIGWQIITIWLPVKSSPSLVLLFITPLILAFLAVPTALAIYFRSFKITQALSVLNVVLGAIVFIVLLFDLSDFNVIGLPLRPQQLVTSGIQNGSGFYLCLVAELLAMIGGFVQFIFGNRIAHRIN